MQDIDVIAQTRTGRQDRKPSCLWLYLLIGVFCSMPAHSASRQEIQQFRTLSYSVINHVLVYHNPNGSPYGLDNAEAYQQDLRLLLQTANQLRLPEAVDQTERLSAAITDLNHLPNSRADIRDITPPYSLWLPQVIEQQALLSARLSELYEQQATISERQRTLHQLSWDIERLLLSYQISAFPNLVAQSWILDERMVVALDASIQKRFDKLSADPELTDSLEKLSTRYQSIRRNLLDPATNWAPSAVARYLLSVARELDSLAENIAR